MDIQRIAVLMGKDARLGAANFMVVYVLVMPVVLSLLIALVFGDLLAQTPRLGIYDPSASEKFTRPLLDHPSINTTIYNSDEALQSAVGRGSEVIGLSLPPASPRPSKTTAKRSILPCTAGGRPACSISCSWNQPFRAP